MLRPLPATPGLLVFPAHRSRSSSTSAAACLVVLPGGGYTSLAEHEAGPVARWANELGMHAVVCRYRHAPVAYHPVPLHDAADAVRRTRRGDLPDLPATTVDPRRVGVIGFSAGGHLAATLCTTADPALDDARPDFAILAYPVISLGRLAIGTSTPTALFDPDTPAGVLRRLRRSLSVDRLVTPAVPPTFLFHTTGDPLVRVAHSLRYADSLARCGVPFELHAVDTPGRAVHGVGLATDDPDAGLWPSRCATWLRRRGLLDSGGG